MRDRSVGLRPLTLDDLPMVERWMRDPRVAEWWSDDPAGELADIEQEVREDGATVYRIFEVDAKPIGLIFRYRIDDYTDYVETFAAANVDLPPGSWSMDYLIGETDAVGRGLGTAMIRAACDEVWSTDAGASRILVPVHADNTRSWRALQRAGFTRIPGVFVMEPDTAAHDGRHVIYALSRPGGDPPR
ncbi:GNAT family N-acetyltransferase [Cumulibacter manganitolerans]|uniref:GNAT family N-acetyltransferase n=1 Tax=Cumulibacter manganitolerans TaxID=1884992 RepID=UPI0012974454|nr:GNAT family N-acetyltransferase [Cumulibacter manganitolerans]